MRTVAAGGSRQDGHEWIRDASLQAWTALREGATNPLVDLLISNENIAHYLTPDEVRGLMDANAHTGTAVTRATDFAQFVREEVSV